MQRRTRKSRSATSSITTTSTINDSGIHLSDGASEITSLGSPETIIDRSPVERVSRTTRSSVDSPLLVPLKAANTRRLKPRKDYVCYVCNKELGGSSDLRKHMRVHTDERPYECEKCPMRFRQSVSLRNHIASIHGTDQKFTCDLCKKSFPLKERLKLHMRIHSGEKPYECSQCSKTFARGGSLRQHMISHHQTKKFKCLECPVSKPTLSALRLHMKVHSNVQKRLGIVSPAKGKEFHCTICNKTLKGHLLQHMKSHENIRSHSCDICGVQFSQKSHLNVHQRMHSGERPYQCRVCWQAFGHSSVLKLHIRKHTGEKPFKCPVCKEKEAFFSQLPHLKNHLKVIHNQDKPYMCATCNEFFKTKNDLKIHTDTECFIDSPEAAQTNDESKLSQLRLLAAILIKRISTENRLKQLGFEKRLIDNVIISALRMAKRKCYDDEKLTEIDRFRLNIEEFLSWTLPADFMNQFRDAKKSTDDMLEELASAYTKLAENAKNKAQTEEVTEE